ncbi:MAG: phosphoadenylyl-sulfate reductase [Nitratireductor sp.]
MDRLLERQSVSPQWDIASLNARFETSGTRRLIETVLAENPGGRVATVSSFGSNSVVLLHLVANIDPTLPVLLVDTGKLFPATLQYREEMTARLGLTNVATIKADRGTLSAHDQRGALWMQNRDACCALRKVAPLADVLESVDIWLSGRKRYQGGSRKQLPLFEADGSRLKINPLAGWTSGDIDIYRNAFGLPQHPLVAEGYRSIGCEPCTTPVLAGEDERAGRWRDSEKSECGIHGQFENGGGI